MGTTITRIHTDHQNMMMLLDLLEEEVAEIKDGGEQGYALLAAIVDYFTHYPDRYHHPLEDLIFAWLAQQHPEQAELVAELRADHCSQERLGGEIALLVDSIESGHLVPRSELVAKITDYITFQRDHIAKEESQVLKAVERTLDEQSRDEPPIDLRKVRDPLFDGSVAAEYQSIAKALRTRRENARTTVNSLA